MNFLVYLFLFIIGLVSGSFLSAFTYRAPRDISTSEGRSKCDKCNHSLHFWENIPLLSYLILRGKCSGCSKKISPRYPIIEFSTSIGLMAIYKLFDSCYSEYFCNGISSLNILSFALIVMLFFVLVAIFIIDLEHQIIPDELVYFLFLISLTYYIINFTIGNIDTSIFELFFNGLIVSSFLLLLNVITFGKGMGLGDVKFAWAIGMFLPLSLSVIWMLMSFVLGSVIGIFFIIIGKSNFGKHIPFGPFLIMSFFLVIIFGYKISDIIMLDLIFR